MDHEKESARFRALGEPVRLRIVRLLAGGELCACDLLANLEISQPTLSHHMKVLSDAGLVTGRREGLWVHYSLDAGTVAALSALVDDLARPADGPSDAAAKLAPRVRKACCR